MSSIVNLVMTTFGFVVSAIFIIFVLVRLLCARLHTRSIVRNWPVGTAAVDSIAGERGANGMDPLVVTLFPTIKFNREVFASREDATCTVCLGEYEEREILRILPQCGHAFHVNCIDVWLRQQPTCPVCRVHLQSSPVRRNMPSPLISEAARSRFSPGAIPENLFEQPLLDSNSPVSEPSPQHAGAFQSSQTYSYGHELGEHAIQVPEGQQVFADFEGSLRMERLASQDLESGHIEEEAESASNDYTWGVRAFGRQRSLEQQRPGKYSFWLWRRWEKGELGMETSNGRVGQEGYEGSSSENTCNDVVNVEMVTPARISLSCQSAEDVNGMSVCSGLVMPSHGDGGTSTVQVQIQAADPSCRGINNKCFEDKIMEPIDTQGASCMKDSGSQDRSSFSSWVRRSQDGCMSESSCTKAEGVSGNEFEIGCRAEDVILGWTPPGDLYSPAQDSDIRCKLDGKQTNLSRDFQTGIGDGRLDVDVT